MQALETSAAIHAKPPATLEETSHTTYVYEEGQTCYQNSPGGARRGRGAQL